MHPLISKTLEARIEYAVKITGNTPQAVISKALDQYIDHEQWLSEEIKKGIDSAKNNPTIPHKQVWEDFEAFKKQHCDKTRKAA